MKSQIPDRFDRNKTADARLFDSVMSEELFPAGGLQQLSGLVVEHGQVAADNPVIRCHPQDALDLTSSRARKSSSSVTRLQKSMQTAAHRKTAPRVRLAARKSKARNLPLQRRRLSAVAAASTLNTCARASSSLSWSTM